MQTSFEQVIAQRKLSLVNDYNCSLLGCENLETVKLHANIFQIGQAAFRVTLRVCVKLASISFPDGLYSMCNDMLMNCESLVEVVIPQTQRFRVVFSVDANRSRLSQSRVIYCQLVREHLKN